MDDPGYWSIRKAAWEAANRPKVRAHNAKYRAKTKTKGVRQAQKLQARYGITLVQYEEMVMAQCGACAVCGEMETRSAVTRTGAGELQSRLAVHHNHETGLVVALLCYRCNNGMGMMGDDPRRLRRAADLQEGR